MKTAPFETHTLEYEEWFEINKYVYESELEAVRLMLPKQGRGIEIGVGTGRFAAPLGIKLGVEPSPKMREIAEKRGIKVIDSVAEKLPFGNESFDYALMVTTLCFLDDVDVSFNEVYRILKPTGVFINGFVDKESRIGRMYEAHKQESPFYRIAKFYSVDEVVDHLEKVGFKDFEFNQTVFHELSDIKSIEPVKPGYGEGSFVTVKARK